MVTNFIFNTAFGYIGISYQNKGISKLNLPVDSYEGACLILGTSVIDSVQPTRPVANIVERIRMYFDGKKVDFPGDFEISGTGFQRKVWDATRRIPYGETMSYSQISALIGNPKAFPRCRKCSRKKSPAYNYSLSPGIGEGWGYWGFHRRHKNERAFAETRDPFSLNLCPWKTMRRISNLICYGYFHF